MFQFHFMLLFFHGVPNLLFYIAVYALELSPSSAALVSCPIQCILNLLLVHLPCTLVTVCGRLMNLNPIEISQVSSPNTARPLHARVRRSGCHEVVLQHGASGRGTHLLPVPSPGLPGRDSGHRDVASRTEVVVMPFFKKRHPQSFDFGCFLTSCLLISFHVFFSVEGCTTEPR